MRGLLFFVAIVLSVTAFGQRLPAWQPGFLDIHHISTGSGNSTLAVMPDGTTLLIDAGDVNSPAKTSPVLLKTSPRLPHDSLSAAKSIRLYLQEVMPSLKTLDYALITHFHGDHFGAVDVNAPRAPNGQYKLTGITEVDAYLPIGVIFDRNFPSYNYPVDLKSHHYDTVSFNNYLKFTASRIKRDPSSVQMLRAGADDQIRMRKKGQTYPAFSVRNIKVNGTLWSGEGQRTITILPEKIEDRDYNENPLSIGIRISYGAFDYFTGGDITGISGNGLPAWFDVETPVARVTGEVDALSLNHHGVRDAMNEYFLKTLQPRVLVQQSWSSNHPGEEVLHRMISKFVYPGERDIFATFVHRETLDTYGRWMKDNYKSISGHVVIRVAPEGKEYYVYILDDRDGKATLKNTYGPYMSR